MKRRVSLLLVLAMLLSMVPFAVSAAEATTLISVTDEAVTADGYVYTFHAETTGTLNVTMGTCSPGWQYVVTGPNDYNSGTRGKFSAGTSYDYDVTAAGDWKVTVYAYTSADGRTAGTVSFTLSFTSDEEGAEVQKAEYEVSQTALALGDNALTLLDTAKTTLFVFEPAETAVYTFTAPEGAILGYWGAGSWLLTDPNSTSNTYEWTCTGVGQKAYIGVSGVDGGFNLNVAKTGDYTVVETPIVPYENKATLEPFTLPEGAKLGSYVDVYGGTHTAVLGDDGYYHLDSVAGDVLLVDMDYQDIILSAALKSDRPVMYAYTTDADGNKVKYDIGNAVLAYEAVMDANGYYPLTEDLILFYDTYAVGAGTYTFHVSGNYNEDCVWMYCMRTMNMDNVAVDPSEPEETEPSEPESSEPSEPEETEPSTEATEPSETPSEPASGTVVLDASATADSGSKYTYKFVPETDGTLTVTVGDGTTNWVSDVYNMSAFKVVTSASGKAAGTYTAELVANTTYFIRVSASTGALAATPVKAVFMPAGGSTEPSEPEVQKDPYAVSTTTLSVGSNTVSMIVTAEATLFKFTPGEAGTYIITGPEGSKVGIWGYSSNVSDPNSTSNSCELNYASVGPTVRVGVTGAEGQIVLTITKNAEPTEPSEPEVTEPSTEATEPEVTEPSEEPSVPESSEPEVTEPSTPSVPDEDVPAGTVFAVIAADGTVTYYSSSSQIISVFKAMTSGTLKLYQDVALGNDKCLEVYAGSTVTLDLNGCTVTNSFGSIGCLYVDGADITVVDTSADQSGLLKNTHASGFGIYVWSGTCTLAGGNVEALNKGVCVQNKGYFVMTGGNVAGGKYGIHVMVGCSADISGGYVAHTIAGTTNNALMAAANTTVSGGYFNGTVSGSGLSGKISGGYFTKTVNTNYIAAGFEMQDNSDEVYKYKIVDPNASTEPEVPTEPVKDAYAVSTTTLSVGSNTVSMIPTAEATLFKFTPGEAGTYIITGPEGSKVGIWGYDPNVSDPNSTSNSCELTLANTGPTIRVGVTGVEGDIVLTIEKQEEPTEPSVPESSEPEETEPEIEPSEPVGGIIVFNDIVTANSNEKKVISYTPSEDGTLTIIIGDGSSAWEFDLRSVVGLTYSSITAGAGSAEQSFHAEVTGGVKYMVRVWSTGSVATPVMVVFTPAGGSTEPSEPETEPTEPSVPDTEPTEPEVSEGVIFSGTDVVASPAAPVTHTWTAQANGTLTVTISGKPGWRYEIMQSNGETLGLPTSSTNGTEKTKTFDVVAGETYTFTVTGFNSGWEEVQGTISYTMTFTPAEGGGEVEKAEYAVSETPLVLGENTLTLLDTAVTTIFVFEPTETAVYTFTAPDGTILGYWGAGSWFLTNPNSTTNTYEWTCTGVGQSAYIGVSSVDGEFILTVAKTGDYEVVETPIVKYENKAELNAFTVPEGATLGAYVDVMDQNVTHTAVLGDDGYYHLDSVDGPILLIDMDYMDIILSAALKSDRPVMYAYMTDEDGNTFKYDIGDAVLAYEAVMDANGYYPVTEDILLFYQVYAVQAGTYTFHVSGNYNEDCVWMYCMRTMTLPEPAVAQVGDTQYATLAEAIAAASGNTVVLLADCADVEIAADVTIDLAGFSLTGVTVAEGATLYLVDSATDDYEGAYGTAEVTGNVASKVTVNGKNYLVVNEDGKYSAHCYALEITHVSLKPADDALGYKAKLYGDAVVQSKVTGYGFNMGVALQKTFEKPGAPVNGEFTLRLQNIMAANGGDMEITASAFVYFGDDVQTTEETKTTMKDTIKAVNNMELDDAQKAAVYALYAKYEAVMAGWFTAEETNNIATWTPQSSEAVPAE